jgi:hypothetical protein
MVNTLAAMYNLKGKQIDFTQAFPQVNLKEDILYLRIPTGFATAPVWPATIRKSHLWQWILSQGWHQCEKWRQRIPSNWKDAAQVEERQSNKMILANATGHVIMARIMRWFAQDITIADIQHFRDDMPHSQRD